MSLVEGLPFKFTFTFPTVSSALKVRVLTSIPTPPIDPSLLFFHAATVIILQLPMLCSLTSFFMNKFMFLETDNIICSGRGKSLPPTPEHSIFFCNFASEITTHNLNHSSCSYQNVTSWDLQFLAGKWWIWTRTTITLVLQAHRIKASPRFVCWEWQ